MSAEQLDLFGESRPAVGTADNPVLQVKTPENLYLGTSSWSFPGWQGLVYDGQYTESRLAREGLVSYAQVPMFGCVSLDRSYYRPPSLEEYQSLAAQVCEGFAFIVKAPRDLLAMTPSSGVDLAKLRSLFLEPVHQGLGEKLGLILLQYPPGSYQSAGSAPRFQDRLASLFSQLPKHLSYSLEVRDTELLDSRMAKICHQHSVGLCASVHPNLPTIDKQLLTVPPPPGQPVMLRWNLRPSLDYKQARNQFHPFRQLRSEDPNRRARVARVIARALQADRKVYLTVNNKAEGSAPLTLRAVLDELLALS